jgi:hypothetical protein
MENRSSGHEAFLSAVSQIEEARARELLDLSAGELSELNAGVGALSNPVRDACQFILSEWPRLDAPARVAALLTLANALSTRV